MVGSAARMRVSSVMAPGSFLRHVEIDTDQGALALPVDILMVFLFMVISMAALNTIKRVNYPAGRDGLGREQGPAG